MCKRMVAVEGELLEIRVRSLELDQRRLLTNMS